MRATHVVEYLLLRGVQTVLTMMPLPAVRSLARRTGRIVYKNLGYRKDITQANLKEAYPDATPEEREDIAVRSYESVAVTLFEFLLFPHFGTERILSMISNTNQDLVESAMATGNGVLLLTAHYGSWELFAQAAGLAAGGDGLLLMKMQANPYTAAAIDGWRTHSGLRTCPSQSGLRDVIRTLESGGWIVIAADQAAPKESVTVEFFGRDVPTYQGPAVLALRTGATILLGVARREADDRYSLSFEKIAHDDLYPASENAVSVLTQRHVRETERLIKEDPGQWMWMHRRWKHLEPAQEDG